MNVYTVSELGKQCTVQADDFSLHEGVIVFRDLIGRATEVFGISPNLHIACEYPDDPIVQVRQELVQKQRAEQLELLRAVLNGEEIPDGTLG